MKTTILGLTGSIGVLLGVPVFECPALSEYSEPYYPEMTCICACVREAGKTYEQVPGTEVLGIYAENRAECDAFAATVPETCDPPGGSSSATDTGTSDGGSDTGTTFDYHYVCEYRSVELYYASETGWPGPETAGGSDDTD